MQDYVKFIDIDSMLEEAKDRLRQIEKDEMPKVLRDFEYAAAQGDLRENADYDEAVSAKQRVEDENRRLMQKCIELEKFHKLLQEYVSTGYVTLGSRVELQSSNMSAPREFLIVPPELGNSLNYLLALDSPQAEGALGKKEGQEYETVTVAKSLITRIISVDGVR